MNKIMCLSLLTAVTLATGCATTGTTPEASTANQPITLEEALQKSAETRQQLENAKASYNAAKQAVKASKQNNTDITTELAKQAVQQQINSVKNQVDAEKEAWKNVLKD